MYVKRFILALAFTAAAATVFGQQRRNFYVDAGAGLGANLYSFYDCISSQWVQDESWFVTASAGWSPLLRFLYITATFMYGRETNSLLSQSVSFETINVSGGLRFYPLRSAKYLQVGLDIGPSFVSFTNMAAGTVIPPGLDTGVTFTGIVAYDFSRSLLGPTLQLGTNIAFTKFESEWIVHTGLFAKAAFKGIGRRGADRAITDDTGDMVLAFPLAAVLGTAVACWTAYRALKYGDRSHVQ
ncbi:MAG: hypothetical protein LBD20_04480 [Spirochaetaceae bacterium]|nr:hypothetical protein [Spirochaetaceae bacterium]